MKKLQPGPVLIDVQGTQLTKEEKKRLKHPLVGGVILFSRNYENPEQLRHLTKQIKKARSGPLLIAVDHEGGRVQRFKDKGFTHLPSMQLLGEYWNRNPLWAMRVSTEIGYILAAELRSCGVDFTFAPVLDLDYGVSTVIGTRSFHRDPKVVAMLARAVIQGMSLAGMAACGKHFPGHGFIDVDSHIDIPVDERDLETILQEDVMPFEWLGDMLLPAIMPAHVIYPKVDAKNAGFSKVWIQDILRERLNYQGMIFSDDLTMEGASVAGNITDRAKAALTAGCDMVLVCNRPDLADQLLAELDVKVNPLSVRRLLRLIPEKKFSSWDKLQKNSRYQYARSFQTQIFSS
ncbi:beta-hexosaminidase [Pelistega indica]|uniref:Beta-hexosaminidase n=2 Tax=Pelistega TaxID=106146 RepID=V8G971_9BURK|nr:beta-hexosaminidase [Pelistega indica]